MQNQIHVYSVDTSAFYNDDEYMLHRKLNRGYILKSKIKKKRNRIYKNYNKNNLKFEKDKKYIDNRYSNINKIIKSIKSELQSKLHQNKGRTRFINENFLTDKNVVSIFESALTRTIQLHTNELSRELIIVQTYFFDVLEDIILNGFSDMNGEKYVVYTASAGQIRTKKTVFIKESTLKMYENQLTCGLTDEVINQRGSININKYLAYRALQNSATDEWIDFDIDKTVVVKDFETSINTLVDFINDETYEITRKYEDVLINHTDGCGIMLPSVCKKSRMVRLPWIKGLLVPFDFKSFVLEHGEDKAKIIDIYGKEYNILHDDIQIIFTESQFKMMKFYVDWKEYKDNFKKYKCQAGYCNEEADHIKKARINYQMLQTLVDMKDNELIKLSSKTNEDILSVAHDKKTMMKVLGVTKENNNKNNLQKAIQYYPQLLNDTYSRDILKQVKRSLVNKGKSGKLSIDAKYTFIIPDLYAFCEWLFLGIENPKGLIGKEEVSCSLYRDGDELDCLRSPHLYFEHCVRKNNLNENTLKWFITKGLYTSCHDIISKILQFDVDGDSSLVCKEKTIVEVAKRNIEKLQIVPLYYNMKKAGSMTIDKQTIYNGLVAAYRGGNIGVISNDITKIWNSNNIDLDVIKLLCLENNFTIDYAKTLYKPERPKKVRKKIVSYTNSKVPHFFIYAKDKVADAVEKSNNSVVNRLGSIIKNPNVKLNSVDGKFDYKQLMSNPKFKLSEVDNEIINKYHELDQHSSYVINKSEDKDNSDYIYQKIRKEILEINRDEVYVTDVLIKYLYTKKHSNKKIMLWECFGDVIVDNIKINLTKDFKYDTIECCECGILIEKVSNRTKYCDECWKEKQKEWQRESMKKLRNSKM